ncbi:YbaB/EbfC family nucleoid-associated protein [Actinoallomurus sp. NBC_01490]|uniref:YbaB/EbfC family nucleoid-associated protein n=1 Tax=Actinoallomurus sp. NBC_01490 TaxID=2903557 RepID=UPI002E363901|nr:YbaB/EbfC family nucleoid-associated protein [Actinoallomurus sp. NBC_01490]
MDDAVDAGSRLHDMVATITRQNTALREAQARMSELRGTGRAAGDRVTVEVDRFGALTGLRIDPRALRLSTEALAEAILDAARQGVRDVRARADEMMRPLVTGSAGANAVADADLGGHDLDDILAALRDVRHDLRM